jgi:hypothetical protein
MFLRVKSRSPVKVHRIFGPQIKNLRVSQGNKLPKKGEKGKGVYVPTHHQVYLYYHVMKYDIGGIVRRIYCALL